LLPSLASPVWDTSKVLPENGLTGMLLHGLIGYDSRPAGMQIVFYMIALFSIIFGMKWSARRRQQSTTK
jgi:high-affinity iron transporter